MSGREVVKENERLLREIVRSIDKDVVYTMKEADDPELRFALQLSLRGREATVSLSIDDLKAAGTNAVRKNAIRQKIKSARDHMLDNHIADVTGKKMARMLKESGASEEVRQRSTFFRRSPPRR